MQSPNVQIVDETSEVRLREGAFERSAQQPLQADGIDMSALPPAEGKTYGKLFSFRSSVKSGYLANFHKRKKGKKLLLACMTCFAAVLVLLTATFGTAFGALIDADQAYNHNVFYVYTPDGTVSQKLQNAVGASDSGIDYTMLYEGYGVPVGDSSMSFFAGYFESFEMGRYSNSLRSHGVCMDVAMAESLPLLAGRKTELAPTDLLITSAVADKLLEATPVSYIKDYESLIGLITNYYAVDQKNCRIAGVVESSETAVYFTENALARIIIMNHNRALTVYPASDFELTLEGDSVIYVTDGNEPDNVKAPKVGDQVTIHGIHFTVTKIERVREGYHYGETESGSMPYPHYVNRGYLLSNEGINRISKQIGDTDLSATTYNTHGYLSNTYTHYYESVDKYGVKEETVISDMGAQSSSYTVLHSTDPNLTEAWLYQNFSDLSTGNDYWNPIITPQLVYQELIKDQQQEISQQLMIMLVLLAVMSVCMYFIMRSSLMNRIKEIGIYRAIGVSKRNLSFRFLIESLVLTTLTVFVGFAVISGTLAAWLNTSPLMSKMFFYPPWLALILLALLVSICLFCGTVPILRLLRKSPSEILAKYDI